jgi:hypothetical protein
MSTIVHPHEHARCSVCHEVFTAPEWEERHEDEDGLDCHEECCPICKKIDTAVAQRLAEVREARR